MVEFLSDGFRAASLLLVCVFAYSLVRYEKRSFRKHVFLFFLLTLLAYLVAYWQPLQSFPVLYAVSFYLSIQLPLAFWFSSRAFFDDNYKWNWIFWLVLILVPPFHYFLYRLNELSTWFYSNDFRFLPYLLSVSFIVLAIIEALRNREDDLLVSRMKKRNIFVLFSALLALVSIYFFFTKDPLQLPAAFDLIQNALTCLFILWVFGAQLSYRNFFEDPSREATSISGEEKKDKEERELGIQKRILEKVLIKFEQQKVFTQEGLTISKLAGQLEEKEYLLRRAINRQLGFTNFNDFLNHYRIQEASKIIRESQYKELTFQEIAFQMGYQSVATFNRAFKKETELTPSEYAQRIPEE